MKVETNCYCNQHPQEHVITVPTRTILHPRLEVTGIKDFHAIPKSVFTGTQEEKSTSRQPIYLTDSDYDSLLLYEDRKSVVE